MANETELVLRLKAFAMIVKFGHDLFDSKNFYDAALLSVNNSKSILNFKTATLLEVNGRKVTVCAQYGQVKVNTHSRLAEVQSRLVSQLKFTKEPLIIGKSEGLPPEMAMENNVYYCVKIEPPENLKKCSFHFVWLLEYEKEIPNYVANAAQLMSKSISEALYYQRLCKHHRVWLYKNIWKKLFWLAVVVGIVYSMTLKIPESSNAEFVLTAPEIVSTYAWFDGPIISCLKQDGEKVQKGDLIAEYDIRLLQYRLSIAKSQLKEIEAEYELEQQSAFTDEARLGKAKLLEARIASASVSVQEAEWYLAHSKIYSPFDGILMLADGRAEQLIGKAVRTGDRLFDVYGGKEMIAEISVNEKDASILRDGMEVMLFLHTAPEIPIGAVIMEISKYPELTEQRVYCYKVRTALSGQVQDMRYGMRGIAKLTGNEVSLGYYLFKSVLLYFREL